VISLTGDPSVVVECGASYSDAGATALDGCAGDLTAGIVTVNPVDTSTPFIYTVTYNVGDGNGNSAVQATRTVTVQDTESPVITVNGPAAERVPQGSAYTPPSYSAVDACGGVDYTSSVAVTGTINTGVLGVQHLYYSVSDAFSNIGEAVHTVEVEPVSTLSLAAVAEEVTVLEGGEARLEVTATGNVGTVHYQWYRKPVSGPMDLVPGGIFAYLILSDVAMSDAGVYVCEGSDNQLSALSPEITLAVDPGVPAASLAGVAGLAALLGLAGAVRSRRRK
jgi:hypothetical protein